MAKEISQAKFFKVFAKTNGHCFYCNSIAEEIDHFVSKKFWANEGVEGDVNDLENLFPTCKKCNASKNAKAPEEFIGRSWVAWDRWFRANKRVGGEKNHPWPIHVPKPFYHFEWRYFMEKYGT